MGYVRIPDKKFGNMDFEHVDMFIAFAKKLKADEWVHFHCKKGQSRTTFFMTLLDMMHNAHKLGMEDIVRRQKIIGRVDLFDVTPKDPSWSSPRSIQIFIQISIIWLSI